MASSEGRKERGCGRTIPTSARDAGGAWGEGATFWPKWALLFNGDAVRSQTVDPAASFSRRQDGNDSLWVPAMVPPTISPRWTPLARARHHPRLFALPVAHRTRAVCTRRLEAEHTEEGSKAGRGGPIRRDRGWSGGAHRYDRALVSASRSFATDTFGDAGNTPLVRIKSLSDLTGVEILVQTLSFLFPAES